MNRVLYAPQSPSNYQLDGQTALPGAPRTRLTDRQILIWSILANVGAAAAWVVIGLLVLGNLSTSVIESTWFLRVAGVAFATSSVLWLAMWREYFHERQLHYTFLWVFLLLTGPVVGPLLFYRRILRTRHRAVAPPNSSSDHGSRLR
jgi:hypothetical protein